MISLVRSTIFIFCSVCYSVASAEIVVIVNSSSDISSLTKVEVANIFLKRIKVFSNDIELEPIDHARGKGERFEFYRLVSGKSANQLNAYWSRIMFTGKGLPPKTLRDDETIKRAVGSDTRYIGYIDSKSLDDSVKVLLRL